MNQKNFALICGIVMLIIGVISFYPNFSSSPEDLPQIDIEASYGLFLNRIPMNVFDKIVFILLGIAGIAVSGKVRTISPAIKFARSVFWIMSALTIFGLFRQTETLFGYWPLFGGGVWMHAIFALVAAYFGYNRTAREAIEKQLVEQEGK